MTIRRLALVLCCLGLAAVAHGLHAQAKPEAIAMTPPEMKWGAQGGLAMAGMEMAGMEQVNLVGDPTKPGPYTLRLKFPAGYKLAPHSHPDNRDTLERSSHTFQSFHLKIGRSIVARRLSNPMHGHLPAVRSLIAAPSAWGAASVLAPTCLRTILQDGPRGGALA
jgi:hypothetical protein